MKTIPTTQLLEQLNWRYAVKQFDKSRKISAADWEALETVLQQSASSGGLQPWTFVVVETPELREKLVPVSYGQTKVAEASHLVVFTAKKNFTADDVDAHIQRTSEVTGAPLESLQPFRGMLVGGIVQAKDDKTRAEWAARQTYIALGNLLTSAAVLGIDACPMEGFDPAKYDEILGLDARGLTATVICTLGYRAATDGYAALPKVRFPKEKVILHL